MRAIAFSSPSLSLPRTAFAQEGFVSHRTGVCDAIEKVTRETESLKTHPPADLK